MPQNWNADVSVVPLQNGMVADIRVRLLLLLAAVGLVLLIACTNVANLTLSRAATRKRKSAFAAAMGAGRGRVIRQLLTESVSSASLGGVLGLGFAAEGHSPLQVVASRRHPRLTDVRMDWWVLAFTGGLADLDGNPVGLAPAGHIPLGALVDSLKSGGRGAAVSVSQRLRSGLLVGE